MDFIEELSHEETSRSKIIKLNQENSIKKAYSNKNIEWLFLKTKFLRLMINYIYDLYNLASINKIISGDDHFIYFTLI